MSKDIDAIQRSIEMANEIRSARKLRVENANLKKYIRILVVACLVLSVGLICSIGMQLTDKPESDVAKRYYVSAEINVGYILHADMRCDNIRGGIYGTMDSIGCSDQYNPLVYCNKCLTDKDLR